MDDAQQSKDLFFIKAIRNLEGCSDYHSTS